MADQNAQADTATPDPNDPLGFENFDSEAVRKRMSTDTESPVSALVNNGHTEAFKNYNAWKNEPFAPELLKLLIKEAPLDIYAHPKIFAELPNAAEWFKYAARRDPSEAFDHFPAFRDKPYARDVLNEAARTDPIYTLTLARFYRYIGMVEGVINPADLPYKYMNGPDGFISAALKQDILPHAAENPLAILVSADFLKGNPDEQAILGAVKHEELLIKDAKESPAAATFAYRYYKDEPYADKVLETALEKNEAEVFEWMAIDINVYHERPDEERFVTVDNELMDAPRLLELLFQRGDSLYTSSYNGVLNRFLSRLDENDLKLADLLYKQSDYEVVNFFQKVTSYGRFEDVFNRLNEEDQIYYTDIMLDYASRNHPDAIQDSAIMSEICAHLVNPAVMKDFETKLIDKFEKAPNDLVRDRLGLLASSYLEHHQGKVSYPIFFDTIAQNPQYKLNSLEKIAPEAFFDVHGRNIQVMTFYMHDKIGDIETDGPESYKNFIRTYQRHPENWSIEDHKSYVHVVSKTGHEVHIYANKPEYDGFDPGKDGIAAIRGAMRTLTPPITGVDDKITLVHRGHSYYLDKTLKYLQQNTPLVFLGSCGGAGNTAAVLGKAPDAQIIATSQTGTMFVNDPLLFHINDKYIREGKPIVWDEVWKYVDTIKDMRREEYINPASNNVAVFVSSFYKLHPEVQPGAKTGENYEIPAQESALVAAAPAPQPVLNIRPMG